jgi:hypothetical protein
MILFSLFPSGLLQVRDVLENRYWHARSLDYLGGALPRLLVWLRLLAHGAPKPGWPAVRSIGTGKPGAVLRYGQVMDWSGARSPTSGAKPRAVSLEKDEGHRYAEYQIADGCTPELRDLHHPVYSTVVVPLSGCLGSHLAGQELITRLNDSGVGRVSLAKSYPSTKKMPDVPFDQTRLQLAHTLLVA